MATRFDLSFPDFFVGASAQEIHELKSLPFTEHPPLDKQYCFFNQVAEPDLLNKVHNKGVANIVGVLPFVQNINPHKSAEYNKKKGYFIESETFAKYLLNHPALMRVYLKYQKEKGYTILTEWNKIARVHSVCSKHSSWFSTHLSIGLAQYTGLESQKKVILLEWSEQNFYSEKIISAKIPLALIHSDEDQKEFENVALKDRVISISAQVDYLNLHNGSIWKLKQDEWIALYWRLSQTYENIIIHVGKFDEHSAILFDQSSLIVYCSESDEETTQFKKNLETIANKNILPPIIEVAKHASIAKKTKISIYPKSVSYENTSPLKLDSFSDYWSWFYENFHYLLFPNKVYYCDHTLNIEEFISYLNSIIKPNESLKSFFNDNLFICNGYTGLYGFLAGIHFTLTELEELSESLSFEKLYRALKPVYPKSGFFKKSSVNKMLMKFCNKLSLQSANIAISIIDKSNNIIWKTNGDASEILSQTIYPPGFRENNEEYLSSVQAGSLLSSIHYGYRLGFNNHCYKSFSSSKKSKKNFPQNLINFAFGN